MVNAGQLETLGFIKGDTFAKTLAFSRKDEDDQLVPIDLTDFTEIRIDVRDSVNENGNLIAHVSLDSGITISGDDNNLLTFKFDRDQSANFTPNVSPFKGTVQIKGTSLSATFNGKYYMDIAFFIGDEIKTLVRADIVVVANITDKRR